MRLETTYASLPEAFYAPATPAEPADEKVVVWNEKLAAELGIEPGDAEYLSGKKIPAGITPIAQAYAGHQFGHFTMLGDGRAILLGEHLTPDGRRVDIQLKGAGQTKYSRRGDGRAALGPMLREYIISEAMHALGISTTRSLAVVATGEPVYREEVLPGAVLTRVAASHLRVGTFEFAATLGPEAVQSLTDYAIQRHYPECAQAENPPLAFFEAVAERQAKLIAQWMGVGFIHGVMNTDNMSIAGETIDYGPCAFMDVFNSGTVFSSIDQQGRYAFGNQPKIAAWNLARLAESLLPLFHKDEKDAIALAQAALDGFGAKFNAHWTATLRTKLGLETADAEDENLITGFLTLLQKSGADFTNSFRTLPEWQSLKTYAMEFHSWYQLWVERLAKEGKTPETAKVAMNAVNPAVIARNYFVEEALAAAQTGNLEPFHQLTAALQNPFVETPGNEKYRQAGPKVEGYRTFCGT